ncbi:hypothetical protein AYK21_05470 [Thermoplasmatales archaeon SG8-52-2]|nr:MAG: hypothetical protein AYK21_05470 [Thermoplasmatales archaeon SG8-52-2]
MYFYYFKNGLTVCVIFILISISIHPCIADMKKEITKGPLVIQGDNNYLANLSMDFGEYIYNNRIEYEEMDYKPPGNQTVNIIINFRCPENLKIIIKYEYFAEIIDYEIGSHYTFFNVKKTITIINGSNPPNINDSKTIFIASRPRELEVTLKIKANLTAYEFLDGEWIKHHNDDIFNETIDWVKFWNCRNSEITQVHRMFLERFPILAKLLNIHFSRIIFNL